MPTKFEAHKVSIAELLLRNTQYRVPKYQRSFSWGDDECGKFIEDIFDFVDSGADEYFMGSIVLCDSPSGFQTVDGQQRIAMFSLLCLVVSQLYKTSSHGKASELCNDVQGNYLGSLDRKTFEIIPRLSLNQNDDVFYQRELLNRDHSREDLRRRGRPRNSKDLLCNAYVTLRDRLRSWVRNRDIMELERLLESLNSVIVIQITVGSESDAYLIFETINDRGLALSTADLVKNYLFSRVGEANIDPVQASWQAINNVVGEFRITKFLRHYWISRYKLVRERYLFDALKNELGSHKQKTVQFLTDLQTEADSYAAFLTPGHSLWNDHPDDVRRNIEALGYIKAEQCFPLLLSAHRTLKKSQFESIVKAATILSFRHTEICGRGTANLETLYSRVAIGIRQRKFKTVPSIHAALKAMYPSDNDFMQAFLVKTATTQLARYILWETERALGGKNLYSDEFTLEHVFPKKPSKTPSWPFQEYVWRLGNLTLLPKSLNKQLRNKPVAEKLKEYHRSGLKLNEYWKKRRSSGQWEAIEIEERQQYLQGFARKIWSF